MDFFALPTFFDHADGFFCVNGTPCASAPPSNQKQIPQTMMLRLQWQVACVQYGWIIIKTNSKPFINKYGIKYTRKFNTLEFEILEWDWSQQNRKQKGQKNFTAFGLFQTTARAPTWGCDHLRNRAQQIQTSYKHIWLRRGAILYKKPRISSKFASSLI